MVDAYSFDQSSVEGKFSWFVQDKADGVGFSLPQLIRTVPDSPPVNFLSGKMLEKVLTPAMSVLPRKIAAMPEWFKFPVSLNESKLLADINSNHCEDQFGQQDQFTDDYLVKTTDAIQYSHYLTFCTNRIIRQDEDSHFKCGFLTVSGTHEVTFVTVGGKPYIPLFYLQGVPQLLTSTTISGWDWAYLRFCCLLQRISQELLSSPDVLCVDLPELLLLLPLDTTLRTFWPDTCHYQHKEESDKYRGQLEVIKDFPIQTASTEAYQINEVPFGQKQLRCINFHPHQFTFWMVPLPEVLRKVWPGHTERRVATILNTLGITIYTGNSLQRDLLRRMWSVEPPLISVIQLLTHFKTIKSKLDNVS